MPTAREIDEAAARASALRTERKPLVVAGVGALLLAASFAAGKALTPSAPPASTDRPRTAAAPDVETAAPPAKPPKGEPRSILAGGDPAAEAPPVARPAPRKADRPAPSPAATDDPSALRVYLVLAATCAALIGTAAWVKKRYGAGRAFSGREKILVVRDQLALDAKRRVVVLGVEGRTLVVGVVGDQLTLLSEFTPPDAEPTTASFPAEARASEPVATVATVAPAAPPAPERAATAREGAAFAAAYVAAKARGEESADAAALALSAAERDEVRLSAPRPAAAPSPAAPAPARRAEPAERFGSPFRRLDAPAPARPAARSVAADRFTKLLEAAEGAR